MDRLRGIPLAALALAAGVACQSHDPAKELALSGVETYWIVDSPQQGQNFVAPTVRFRLKNIGPATIGSVQARARFPAPDQDEVWGSIQEQVSTWSRPLERGQEVVVTVRSAGRYHAATDPEEILRSPAFKDPKVEVYVRIGSSNWALMAEASVARRIGAPGTLDLAAGR
jgi:hypothetical protein